MTIPAYGDGPLLRTAVASVLEQEDSRWLLTITDDGPPSPELEAWIAGLGDARVVYGRNENRLGLNRNFQRCLELAAAPYVVVMGADDRLLPNFVAVVAEAAHRFPDAAWIQPRVRVIDGDGRPASTLADRVKARIEPAIPPGGLLIGGEELARSLLIGVWMYFPAVAFRRDSVLQYGFREGYDVVLDLDLYLRMLVDGASAAYSDTVAFEYRRHAASVSSSELMTGARFAEDRAFFREAADSMRRRGWQRAARAARLRPTSRLHALAYLPRAHSLTTVGMLLRHASGS